MKLPDIEYGAPVQRSSDSLAQVDEAQRRAAATLSAGLTRYGMELVKVETQAATAELDAGLADLESGLMSRRYVSTGEIRNVLGADFESLPPETRQRLTRPMRDIATGEMVQEDRDDVPVWEVSGAIFQARAKRLLEGAAQRIGPSGWRNEFQARAQEEVTTRQIRVAHAQLRAMDEDLRARQGEAIETLTRARSFDKALAVVGSSDLFAPAEKEKLVGQVEHARQLQPLEDRLLLGVGSTDDVVEAGKLIGRLESGEGLDRLEDKERIEWKRRLEAEVKGFEHEAKAAIQDRFAGADEATRNTILDWQIRNPTRPIPVKLLPRPGTVSSRALEWAQERFAASLPGKKPQEFDPAAYAAVSSLARDPAVFRGANLLDVPAFGRLLPTDQKHFLELQRTLKADPDGPNYSGFVGAQEETNRHLESLGFSTQGKKAETDAAAVGWVHSVVDTELFRATRQKGRQLDLEERNKIVASTVAREVRAKGWFGRGGVKAQTVDPTYVGPLRVAADALGRRQDEVEALAGEVHSAEALFEAPWRARSGGRPLTPELSVRIFTVLRGRQAEIDAALQKAGRPASETYRVLAAIDFVLAEQARGRRR